MKDNKIREAFSQIHAPEGVLREVNMRISENEARRHDRPRRYGKLIPIAAILAAVLALSVAAYGFIHSDFYKNAFGTGVESQAGGPKDYYDREGNLVKTVDEPAVDRVEVDPALADKLVGDAVASVGEPVCVGEFTVTVGEFVFDENGIGTVTVDISHPQGHVRYNDAWWNEKNGYPICNYEFFESSEGFRIKDATLYQLGEKAAVAKGSSTETTWRVIYYVAPFNEKQESGEVYYVFNAATALARSLTKEQRNSDDFNYSSEELYDTVKIPLKVKKRVAAKDFICGDETISVSPLGAKLPLGKLEIVSEIDGRVIYETKFAKEFVITFADGTEYVVNDAGHVNTGEGALDDEAGVSRLAFNRLVDVDEIESISITTQDGVERTYVKA